jgi:hypothetical protein
MQKKYLDLGKQLSRNEIKLISGGNGGAYCRVGVACNLYVSDGGKTGTTYTGTCGAGWGGGSGAYMECGCETSYGPYVPTNQGGSTCISHA